MRDWSELTADCGKLRAAGVVPMLYGSDTQAISSEFYPFYDFSYLMAGAYPLSEWKGFANGKISLTSAPIVDQVTKWAALHANGCTNKDVLTTLDILTKFGNGAAAMIIDGNWNLQQLYDTMGSNLGVFPLPFADKPMKGVVQFPGDGILEAATIDGAGLIATVREIILPLMTRFIIFASIITLIAAFTALFSLIFVMTGGGPGFSTTTMEFYIYRLAFGQTDFGMGATVGVVLLVFIAIISAPLMAVYRRVSA